MVVHQKPPALTTIRPDFPDGLAEMMARALSKKPADRFQTGAEMAEAMQPFLKTFKTVEQRPLPQLRLIRQLREQTFFKNFSEVEVDMLLQRVSVKTFEPGDSIRSKGELVKRLIVITHGVVKSTRNGKCTHVLSAGDCLGETGFIHGTAEPQDHTALTAVSALEITTEALAQLPPKVHLHYYRYISDVLLTRLEKGQKPSADLTL